MRKTIIQIGSHVGNTLNDPIFNIVDNNTRLILVEPVPYLFRQLKNNYTEKFGTSDNITFINKAVSNFIGEIEMTIPSEDNDFEQFPWYASQLGSLNSSHAASHLNGLKVERITVETTTINEIIKDYNIKEIDLLHTDTEGHDYVILMNYNFEIKPKKLMFEHMHMDGLYTVGAKFVEMMNVLYVLGYKILGHDTDDTTLVLEENW